MIDSRLCVRNFLRPSDEWLCLYDYPSCSTKTRIFHVLDPEESTEEYLRRDLSKVVKVFQSCSRNSINFFPSLRPLHTPITTRWRTRITWLHRNNYHHCNIARIHAWFTNTISRISTAMLPIRRLYFDTIFINIDEFTSSGTVKAAMSSNWSIG